MYKIISDFEKQAVVGSDHELISFTCGNEVKAYELLSVHEIIQFIGYAKNKNKSIGNVYFRGQTDLYDGKMIPSLFRNVKNIQNVQCRFSRSINSIMRKNKKIGTFDRTGRNMD